MTPVSPTPTARPSPTPRPALTPRPRPPTTTPITIYEKETHCSIRLVQPAPGPLLGGSLLDDHGNTVGFLSFRGANKHYYQRTLTFAERVAYQRAIEDVYWRHRIWPRSERPDPKPSLDAVMSQAQLEEKVHDYLRKSQALEDYWYRPINAEQLQAEMDRMAQHTKQPEVLRELFKALGDDPFVIAECLARPMLAERLVTNWNAFDERIHGDLRKRAEGELQAHPTVEQMRFTSGTYTRD